jgi:hypothetical protein
MRQSVFGVLGYNKVHYFVLHMRKVYIHNLVDMHTYTELVIVEVKSCLGTLECFLERLA